MAMISYVAKCVWPMSVKHLERCKKCLSGCDIMLVLSAAIAIYQTNTVFLKTTRCVFTFGGCYRVL